MPPSGATLTSHSLVPNGISSLMSIKSQLGLRAKALRKARQLTLVELAKVSGVSVSTISKIENGTLSPTMDVILRLCDGLVVSISELLGEGKKDGAKLNIPNSRFSPARKNEGVFIETPNYDYTYLCSDLKNKAMVPILATLKANAITRFGDLVRHGGEEFVLVLEGSIEVHSEFYQPLRIERGEGVYLDSTMGHAYLNAGDADAKVICICTHTEEQTDAPAKPTI